MFEDMKQYMKRVVGIDDRSILISTDGTQVDSQKIPEPTIVQTEETLIPLYKGEELKKSVCFAVRECYPDIHNLSVNIIPSKIYIGNGNYLDKYCLTIFWENGVSECLVRSIVDCMICDYLDYTHGEVPRNKLRVQTKRTFTDDVILKASRKFADCIAPHLPLNMHNVHCFKIGGVPIYDLAVGELQLMDNVKEVK